MKIYYHLSTNTSFQQLWNSIKELPRNFLEKIIRHLLSYSTKKI